MVKVQKPQPKSLTKSSSIEGVAKKKGKQEKSKKLPEEVAVAVVASAKKVKKNADPKPVEAKAKKEQKKLGAKPEVEKKPLPKAVKKALVLAPAHSPTPAPPSPAVPAKTAAVKRSLILAPPESPVVPKKKGKSKAAAPAADKKEKSAKKDVETEAPPAKKSAAAKKSVAVATPAKKSTAAVPAAVKKSAAAAAPTKKSAAAAAPAKKSAADAPLAAKKPAASGPTPGKKSAAAAPPAKKSQKPAAAEAPKKSQKPDAAEAPKKSKQVAKPAASLQKQAKSAPKISKPAKAPKAKRSTNNKKNIAAKGKPIRREPLKTRKPAELTFELKSFDEDRYKEIVSEANVTKISDALRSLVEGEVAKKKTTSIFTDYRYMLQVASYKIASCPKRVAKLALKHSLVSSDDDVAIIVPDLQRGAKFDFEPTKQHYEDLFREAGVEQRLTIVPFNQLRNEMGTFEAKRKFLNSYDYLLCDGRLSGQASAFLGKATQKPRNVLHAVRLNVEADQLAKEINRALKRTAYRQLAKGDLTTIPVGNHQHSAEQLAENILLVSQQLQKQFPGGLANIRSLYLKIDIVGTSSLPLYISMCAPPADTPYVVGPREQRMLKLKKQANEVLSRFAMTKDAEFVKLTADQVKRKAELKQKKADLVAADAAPKDNDGEDTAVPTKKARKESNSEAAKAAKADEVESDEEDAEEAAGEDESGEEGDDTDDDDIDEEDDDEDEEDDDDEDEEDDDDEDDDEDDE